MKKKLALLLACTMALGLTACGGSKPAAAPETTAAATEAAAESSEESKADEKTEAAGGDMDAQMEMTSLLSAQRSKQLRLRAN